MHFRENNLKLLILILIFWYVWLSIEINKTEPDLTLLLKLLFEYVLWPPLKDCYWFSISVMHPSMQRLPLCLHHCGTFELTWPWLFCGCRSLWGGVIFSLVTSTPVPQVHWTAPDVWAFVFLCCTSKHRVEACTQSFVGFEGLCGITLLSAGSLRKIWFPWQSIKKGIIGCIFHPAGSSVCRV